MKHLRSFIFISFIFVTLPLRAEEIKIDTDFPGGNIKVLGIDGDAVKLSQDLRDTEGSWFYWSFRIRGAEGRALHFTLPGIVGARGPAVRHDGMNWHWLSDKAGFSRTEFSYQFGADEKRAQCRTTPYSWQQKGTGLPNLFNIAASQCRNNGNLCFGRNY